MQAWQTCQQRAVVHVSTIVPGRRNSLSDSNNNEQLFINLDNSYGQTNILSRLRKLWPLHQIL